MEKYKGIINNDDIMYFYNNDPTKTKKYFEYMLKTYGKPQIIFRKDLVEAIHDFEKYKDCIKIKDIYNSYYNESINLFITVRNAKESKRKKDKIKKEGNKIIVLHKSNKILMIHPLTHGASIKYGANTTWCTTEEKHEKTFIKYKLGCLVYVIVDGTKKYAFHTPYENFEKDSKNFEYKIYNEIDEVITKDDIYVLTENDFQILDGIYRKFVNENKNYFEELIKKFPESKFIMGFDPGIAENVTNVIHEMNEMDEIIYRETMINRMFAETPQIHVMDHEVLPFRRVITEDLARRRQEERDQYYDKMLRKMHEYYQKAPMRIIVNNKNISDFLSI